MILVTMAELLRQFALRARVLIGIQRKFAIFPQ